MGVFGAIGGAAVGGGLGLLSAGKNDQAYQGAAPDGGLDLGIKDYRQQYANKSLEAYAKDYNERTEEGSQFNPDATLMRHKEMSLGQNGPDISEALQNRANRNYGFDLNQIQRQNQSAGLKSKHQAQMTASGLENSLLRTREGMAIQRAEYDNEAEAARNAMISNILNPLGSMTGIGAYKASGTQAGNVDRGMSANETQQWNDSTEWNNSNARQMPASNSGGFGGFA